MMKNRSGNRQIISFIMILIILVNSITSGYPVSAAEVTVVAQGSCGQSAEWTLYSDGLMEITGTGEVSGDSLWSEQYMLDISKLVIGEGITNFGIDVFRDIIGLKCVELPGSLEGLGCGGFSGCVNLESVLIPDNITVVPGYIFDRCENMKNIVLPDGVVKISDYAFHTCSRLESINLKDTAVRVIDTFAFTCCRKLKRVELPDTVEYICKACFWGCEAITDVILSKSEKFTTLRQDVFAHCNSITTINIPSNITTIEESAFSYCEGLKSVVFEGDFPKFEPYVFSYMTPPVLYYPEDNETWENVDMSVFGNDVPTLKSYKKGEQPWITPEATPEPTASPDPTLEPTAELTASPDPTLEPTAEPTASPDPTLEPTAEPTASPCPTLEPTAEPTASPGPTLEPTAEPTASPSPTPKPTASPSPTPKPTASPGPTLEPTEEPTANPSPTPDATEEPDDSAGQLPEEPVESKKPKITPILTHKAAPTYKAASTYRPVATPGAVSATETQKEKDKDTKKLTAPTYTLKKAHTSKGAKCIKVTLKKYKGRYVQLFLYKGNKKIRIKISSNDIKKNKKVFRLTYSGKNITYVFMIRTYKVVKGRKIYSSYSKKKKIRV